MAEAAMAALAAIPKPVALSAATALLSYLNAKHAITTDISNVYRALAYAIYMKGQQKKDRVNVFYHFEALAKDPTSASRVFLLLPSETVAPGQQTEWTYHEAYEMILKYAAWLKDAHGVQKGEMIAMDFANGPQFIWLWLALWSLGAIPAFINHNLRDNAFVHSVRVSTARLLIMDPNITDALNDETRKALSADEKGRAVDICILDSATQDSISTFPPYRAPDTARSGAEITHTSLLIYTSGTTGLPKAAKVAWQKPLSALHLWPGVLGLTPSDRYFTALPIYHSSGSVLGVCQAIGAGCTMVVAPKFSPRTFTRHLATTNSTALQYIGEMCRYLVSSPPSVYDTQHSVRVAFGNGMRPDVWPTFKSRFNIDSVVEFYGSTEGPSASFVHSRNDYLLGAIGRQGFLVRTFLSNSILVRHDHVTDAPWRDPRTNFCVRCVSDEIGELLHPLDPQAIVEKYQGYWGNEGASDSKIMRDVFKKGDAYYRTGDLQKRDAEGRWFFMDRVGDTYRWKSENISTAEVSTALSTHPAILEANVFGVSLPNHDGRAGCAAILLAPGSSGSQNTLTPTLARDLAEHCRARLPRYAVPVFLRILRPSASENEAVAATPGVGAAADAGGQRAGGMETTGTLKQMKASLRGEGVEPAKVGDDEVWWLPPGAGEEGYERFSGREWGRVEGGEAKL